MLKFYTNALQHHKNKQLVLLCAVRSSLTDQEYDKLLKEAAKNGKAT